MTINYLKTLLKNNVTKFIVIKSNHPTLEGIRTWEKRKEKQKEGKAKWYNLVESFEVVSGGKSPTLSINLIKN